MQLVRARRFPSLTPYSTDSPSVALYHNRLEVVQASLLGSILVNLLPVLGIAILAGSLRHHDLSQNREAAQRFASLLSFSVVSLLVPVSLPVQHFQEHS
jgi:calcium/proton exchanger cax